MKNLKYFITSFAGVAAFSILITLTGGQIVIKDDYEKYKAAYEAEQLKDDVKCERKTTQDSL